VNQARKFAVLIGVIVIVALVYYFVSVRGYNGLQLIGVVDANQVIVSPKITGRIEKLLVDEGSEVKQGDLIAQLDTAELAAQQEAAAAAVASMRSQVSGSQANEVLTKGTTVGDVANAQSQLQTAKANLAQAQADLARIAADTRRTDDLAAQGVASQQEKQDADATLKAQQERVRSAEEQVRASQAALDSAQARLHQQHVAASTVAATRAQQLQAQANVAEAEARLGYTNIYAPVSGTVSVRVAREGEVVNPGEPIVTLVDFNETWVRASIPETDADHIAIGDTLQVRMPSGELVPGKVILKAAEADFATQRDVSRQKRDIRTLGLKLLVPNPKHIFVPGMTAIVLVPDSKIEGK
jgi:multidrug resistance efflux pump